jgi:D-cysteine desulfhydrase family pyridoxal phosphate-dependent enzyme
MNIDTLEKIGFCKFPTPLEEMTGLEKELKTDKRLFIKRDDTTIVGLGGNKNRKLELVMAEARRVGADTIITWAGLQSNHCRQTLSYAIKMGMECHLILNGEETNDVQGNLLIFKIFGAHLHFEPNEDLCDQRCRELVTELIQKGKNPYYVPIGASTSLGSVAYIECAREIGEQLSELGLVADHIYLASGSAGTHAGLLVGAKRYLNTCKIHGAAVSRSEPEQQAKVLDQSTRLIDYVGWTDLELTTEDIYINDHHLGEGYAIPSESGVSAILRVGRSEAILLDPVYTGKAMACLIEELPALKTRDNGVIVFLHSGGWPAVFEFNDYINQYIISQ